MKFVNATVEITMHGVELPLVLQFGTQVSLIRVADCHTSIHYIGGEKLTFNNPEFFSITLSACVDKMLGSKSAFALIKEHKISQVRVYNDEQDEIYRLNVPIEYNVQNKVVYGEWGDGGMIYTFSWEKK